MAPRVPHSGTPHSNMSHDLRLRGRKHFCLHTPHSRPQTLSRTTTLTITLTLNHSLSLLCRPSRRALAVRSPYACLVAHFFGGGVMRYSCSLGLFGLPSSLLPLLGLRLRLGLFLRFAPAFCSCRFCSAALRQQVLVRIAAVSQSPLPRFDFSFLDRHSIGRRRSRWSNHRLPITLGSAVSTRAFVAAAPRCSLACRHVMLFSLSYFTSLTTLAGADFGLTSRGSSGRRPRLD